MEEKSQLDVGRLASSRDALFACGLWKAWRSGDTFVRVESERDNEPVASSRLSGRSPPPFPRPECARRRRAEPIAIAIVPTLPPLDTRSTATANWSGSFPNFTNHFIPIVDWECAKLSSCVLCAGERAQFNWRHSKDSQASISLVESRRSARLSAAPGQQQTDARSPSPPIGRDNGARPPLRNVASASGRSAPPVMTQQRAAH